MLRGAILYKNDESKVNDEVRMMKIKNIVTFNINVTAEKRHMDGMGLTPISAASSPQG